MKHAILQVKKCCVPPSLWLKHCLVPLKMAKGNLATGSHKPIPFARLEESCWMVPGMLRLEKRSTRVLLQICFR